MKRRNYIVSLMVSLTMIFSSCDGLFRDIPNDKLSQESIWKSELLLDEYVLPWYRNMNNGFSIYMPTNALIKGLGRIYLPWYGDQLTVSKADWYNTAYGDILKSNTQEITRWGLMLWTNYYTRIQSVNLLFENENEIPNGEHKKRILGEAHFFRAYYYYMLMRQFGGVLLIRNTYNPLKEDIKYPRASYEEMVKFITEEAARASQLLPVKYDNTNTGRVTKGAALMLVAKTYLWAASDYVQNKDKSFLGFPDNRKTAMLEKAKAAYDDFFALNAYELMPVNGTSQEEIKREYRKIFLTKNSMESILEVQHSDDGDFGNGFGHKLDRESVSPYWGGTTAAYSPTHNHALEYGMQEGYTYDEQHPFDNRDYRFYANILYDGCTFRSRTMELHYTIKDGKEIAGKDLTPYDASQSSAVSKTGYYMGKFVDESQVIDNDPSYGSKQNFIIWRYAEALLDYAEIQFALGNSQDALNKVNDIRRRAHMYEWSDIDEAKIRNERRVELAFEETTYWDLFRWGIANEKMNGSSNPLKIIKIVKEDGKATIFSVSNLNKRPGRVRYFDKKQYYLPLPWDEIRFHGVEQNPEWKEV